MKVGSPVQWPAAIIGGALGIGRATALCFAAEGASVALGDVEVGGADAVAKEIVERGGHAIAVGVDVGDSLQVQAFVDRVVGEFGRIDVMFANAGIAHSAPFLEHPEEQWHRVLRVNLTGVFLCCQAAARQMVKQGGGRIIITASINGFRGVENLVGYNVAKAGVVELTRTMAVELAQHRVAVNAIAPAQIDTRLTRSLPAEARRRRAERIPMGRFGEPDEVARAALFLASDEASFITGHTLAVDGGYLAGGLWSSPPAPSEQRSVTDDSDVVAEAAGDGRPVFQALPSPPLLRVTRREVKPCGRLPPAGPSGRE